MESSSLLARPCDASQVIAPLKLPGEAKEEERGGGAGGPTLAMYLASAPVRDASETQGGGIMRAPLPQSRTAKQIAARDKLPKPFGDIICMTKHVSATDRET